MEHSIKENSQLIVEYEAQDIASCGFPLRQTYSLLFNFIVAALSNTSCINETKRPSVNQSVDLNSIPGCAWQITDNRTLHSGNGIQE